MKILLLLSLLSFGQAFAFEVTSGVQQCEKEVILYSFYEGSHPKLHHISLWKEEKDFSISDYLNKALAHLKKDSPNIYDYVGNELRSILHSLKTSFVPKLPQGEDKTDVVFLEEDCSYKPIAGNSDDGKLLINQDLFLLMSPMNQAGLLYQEAHYRMMRKFEQNTDPYLARLWVAKIFSDESITYIPPRSDLSPEEKTRVSLPYCESAMKLLTMQVKHFVQVAQYCKEQGRNESIDRVYSETKILMNETINNCYKRCFWDKAIKQCKSFEDLIGKANACD